MKRDEVLARSREECKDHDEMMVDIFKKQVKFPAKSD